MTNMALELREQETRAVERALPAHMMVLMLEQCAKVGVEGRPDLRHHLNVAGVAPLSQLDTLSIARVAKRIDDAATSLLNDLSPDDPREGLYVCAMFCQVLVDEERIDDPKCQAVLSALLILDEAKDDASREHGDPIWQVNLAAWEAKARAMLTRAMLLGYFLWHTCN